MAIDHFGSIPMREANSSNIQMQKTVQMLLSTAIDRRPLLIWSVSRMCRIHQPLRALVLACGSMSYMKRQHQLTLNNHLAHAFYRSLSLSESLKFWL